MKKYIAWFLSVALLAVTAVGCAKNEDIAGAGDGTISVVATIFPLYDFARAVAGDKADVKMLIKPGAEVHAYEPSPADIVDIQEADAFLYIGGEDDAWVDTMLESTDNGEATVRLMDAVSPVEEETVEGMEEDHGHDHDHDADAHDEDAHHEDEHHEDEHHEDGEIEYDEHIWTSPRNAIAMINAIAEALCAADAQNADAYRKNAQAYTSQIQEVDDEIHGIVRDAARTQLIVADRFPFRYFADEFGLTYSAAFPGCSSETEASAGTLAHLINTVKENDIPYVYYIELSNQQIAKAVSEQTGAGMLLLHSCHNVTKDEFDAGVTYLSLMRQNAENLEKGLNE